MRDIDIPAVRYRRFSRRRRSPPIWQFAALCGRSPPDQVASVGRNVRSGFLGVGMGTSDTAAAPWPCTSGQHGARGPQALRSQSSIAVAADSRRGVHATDVDRFGGGLGASGGSLLRPPPPPSMTAVRAKRRPTAIRKNPIGYRRIQAQDDHLVIDVERYHAHRSSRRSKSQILRTPCSRRGRQ
jgi:hypothetical protein